MTIVNLCAFAHTCLSNEQLDLSVDYFNVLNINFRTSYDDVLSHVKCSANEFVTAFQFFGWYFWVECIQSMSPRTFINSIILGVHVIFYTLRTNLKRENLIDEGISGATLSSKTLDKRKN